MNNPFESIDARLSKIESLLHQFKELPLESATQSKEDEFLTTEEAAKFLKIAVSTIYALNHKGELPVMKRGKRCYFSKHELSDYLRQGRSKTLRETEKESLDLMKKADSRKPKSKFISNGK
jgi:excisionase family DNA binding protein